MRTLLNAGDWMLWILFFASGVYGHLALKLAVGSSPLEKPQALLRACTGAWGLTAFSAWALSAGLWMLLLSRHSLARANAISALGSLLLSLSAWLLLHEAWTWSKTLGAVLVAAGIYLVAS